MSLCGYFSIFAFEMAIIIQMTRHFLLIFALLVSLPMMAQEWEFKTVEADDFYNTEASDVAIYQGDCFFVMLSFTNDEFTLKLTDGDKFDKIDIGEMAFMIIGLYDENGKLIKRGEVWAKMNRRRTSCTLVNPTKSGWIKWVTEIKEHLEGGKGAIRLASPTLGCDYFDVTIPCFHKR